MNPFKFIESYLDVVTFGKNNFAEDVKTPQRKSLPNNDKAKANSSIKKKVSAGEFTGLQILQATWMGPWKFARPTIPLPNRPTQKSTTERTLVESQLLLLHLKIDFG